MAQKKLQAFFFCASQSKAQDNTTHKNSEQGFLSRFLV